MSLFHVQYTRRKGTHNANLILFEKNYEIIEAPIIKNNEKT